MGRGSSKAGGGGGGKAGAGLSREYKDKITKGILDHSEEQNNIADESYRKSIAKEKETVENYEKGIKAGVWKEDDPRTIYHREALDSLRKRYEFFKKERKRLKR